MNKSKITGRPIGAGIRSLCAAVERLGPCDSRATAKETGSPITSITRCAGRAEVHGLLCIDRTVRPNIYTVIPGWKHAIDHKKDKREVSACGRVNSIFQMGDMAGVQA